MKILELRILPPLAVARLGASETPLECYSLEPDESDPLGFRRIVPEETLELDPEGMEIVRAYVPDEIRFRDGDRIRPVAPFLESPPECSRRWASLRPTSNGPSASPT
jgi:hypothetical protein